MFPIQSIIVFNSGSAGDFLMGLCCSQIDNTLVNYKQLNSGRMLIDNEYFKTSSQKLFYNPDSDMKWDFSKTYKVENSHFWLDAYKDLASRCVYIDYPDQVQESIMDIFIEKVYNNDIQKMLDFNLPNMLPALRPKITINNTKQVYNVLWRKNLIGWHNNKNLTAIELKDFFYKNKLENIVKKLINNKISNQEMFDNIYNNWLSKNTKLRELFL